MNILPSQDATKDSTAIFSIPLLLSQTPRNEAIYTSQPAFSNIAYDELSSTIKKTTQENIIHRIGSCASAHIVQIGAGPVGLMMVYNLKCLKPDLDIVCLDKRSTYTRKHSLRLTKKCFKNAVCDVKLNGVIDQFKNEIAQKKSIPSLEIEMKLKQLCIQKGIRFITDVEYESLTEEHRCDTHHNTSLYQKSQSIVLRIQGFSQLQQLFPYASIFIGADGSHSAVRTSLFRKEVRYSQTLQYTALVRYEVAKPPRRLDALLSINIMQLVDRVVIEQVSATSHGGRYSVTLHIFLSALEYALLSQSDKWKKQRSLNSCDLHPNVQTCIKTWINARHMNTLESEVENVQIVAVPLDTYASPYFAVLREKKIVVLVGDAAFGVPFNQSCANGFTCAIKLAHAISKIVENNRMSMPLVFETMPQSITAYTTFMTQFSLHEIAFANFKSFILNLGTLGVQMLSRSIFNAAFCVSEKKKKELMKGPFTTKFPPSNTITQTIQRIWTSFTHFVKLFIACHIDIVSSNIPL